MWSNPYQRSNKKTWSNLYPWWVWWGKVFRLPLDWDPKCITEFKSALKTDQTHSKAGLSSVEALEDNLQISSMHFHTKAIFSTRTQNLLTSSKSISVDLSNSRNLFKSTESGNSSWFPIIKTFRKSSKISVTYLKMCLHTNTGHKKICLWVQEALLIDKTGNQWTLNHHQT